MLKFAHIINPVNVSEISDLFLAQPVTFKTMQVAKEFSLPSCQVELFAAVFPEDRSIVPDSFTVTADLDRSVLDLGNFRVKRKLPVLRDILDRLYDASNADYFIYTNTDIGLQPYFYVLVNNIIQNGIDAFIINRRTIAKEPALIKDLPMIYSQAGQPHPGHDCFIFRREIYPEFILNDACLGVMFIGKILAWNLAAFSRNFFEFKDLHASFHLGDDRIWSDERLDDYKKFNHFQAKKTLSELIRKRPGVIEHLKKLNLLMPEQAFVEFIKSIKCW